MHHSSIPKSYLLRTSAYKAAICRAIMRLRTQCTAAYSHSQQVTITPHRRLVSVPRLSSPGIWNFDADQMALCQCRGHS